MVYGLDKASPCLTYSNCSFYIEMENFDHKENFMEAGTNFPKVSPSSRKFQFLLAVILLLLVFFFPINGRSLLDRLVDWKQERVVNLVPNPSFEEGLDNQPAGWTTKSRSL